MSRNYRFTISLEDTLNKAEQTITIRSKELLHQINNVLRLKLGHAEELTLIDGSGEVFYAEIQSITKSLVELKILKIEKSQRELDLEIVFFIPVIKLENFTWMLRKLVELGVQSFVPVIFERSQKPNIQALASPKAQERFRKIIQEATEQCEAAVFARLHDAIEFNDIKNHLKPGSLRVFANERLADANHLSPVTYQLSTNKLCLLVGPEGGLTEQEVIALESLDFMPCGLGKRFLKAETAAISLLLTIFNNIPAD